MCVCVCSLTDQSTVDERHDVGTLIDHTHQNVIISNWNHYIHGKGQEEQCESMYEYCTFLGREATDLSYDVQDWILYMEQ